MVRVLTSDENSQVQSRLCRPINSRPEFTSKASMIAARPAWMSEVAAETLCDRLCAEGFTLSPNAPGAWVWQKHIAGTAIEHSLVFMQCMWDSRPWLKSYSHDLCTGKFEDALGDSTPSCEDLANVQLILDLFKRNEEMWHTSGFSRVNDI